jgi:hypothetical protein
VVLNRLFGGAMKALKVMATIDEQGQLTLDRPLITDKNSRVEVLNDAFTSESLNRIDKAEVHDWLNSLLD